MQPETEASLQTYTVRGKKFPQADKQKNKGQMSLLGNSGAELRTRDSLANTKREEQEICSDYDLRYNKA